MKQNKIIEKKLCNVTFDITSMTHFKEYLLFGFSNGMVISFSVKEHAFGERFAQNLDPERTLGIGYMKTVDLINSSTNKDYMCQVMHLKGSTIVGFRVFDKLENKKFGSIFTTPTFQKVINFDGGCDEKSTNYSYLLRVEFIKMLKGKDEMLQCVVVVTNFLVIFYDLEAILFSKS